MAEELCKHNFVDKDSNYHPDIYQKLSVYFWRSVQRHPMDRVINFVKEEKFGMRSGMMIVRDLGQGRHVMYYALFPRSLPLFAGGNDAETTSFGENIATLGALGNLFSSSATGEEELGTGIFLSGFANTECV